MSIYLESETERIEREAREDRMILEAREMLRKSEVIEETESQMMNRCNFPIIGFGICKPASEFTPFESQFDGELIPPRS